MVTGGSRLRTVARTEYIRQMASSLQHCAICVSSTRLSSGLLKMKLNLLVVLLVATLVQGCATNAAGRGAFILIDDASMNQMGITAFSELKQKTRATSDARTSRYATCVSRKLIAELPQQWRELPWEVVVFEDDSPNAFALPGGKVGVHTGLLKIARSEDQLAAVIGHELAHVWLRHGAERVSQQYASQAALTAVQAYGESQGNGSSSQVMALIGLGAQVGVLLPFSRKHESEADRLGQQLMAEAGYDPAAAAALWANMQAASGRSTPQFLSTHPNPSRRQEVLAERAQSAQIQAAVAGARASGKAPSSGRP